MSVFSLEGPADARKELLHLLLYNNIDYIEENGNFRFIFSNKGQKWENCCNYFDDGAVLLYSYYPFSVTNEKAAEAFCQKVNSMARYGAMLYQNKQLFFRIGADLFDTYSAYEVLGRALEYSAGIMAYFWMQASTAAEKI